MLGSKEWFISSTVGNRELGLDEALLRSGLEDLDDLQVGRQVLAR